MSNAIDPPISPSDALNYSSAADSYAQKPSSQTDEDESDEDESGEGKSGGKGLGKYKVVLDPFLDFSDDMRLSEDEQVAAKLRKLDIAPISTLVSGASAFASENDLSRKVFMAKVGVVNSEIQARDIASPGLFKFLDGRAAERRSLFGIKTLDEIVTGAIGAAGAAIKFVSDTVSEALKEKKEARKMDKLLRNFDEGAETYALDSDDYSASQTSLEAAEFPVQANQGEELASQERERLYDDLARNTQIKLNAGEIGFAEAFNALADIINLSRGEPVRTVRLSEDIHFGPEIPGADQELNPMGG